MLIRMTAKLFLRRINIGGGGHLSPLPLPPEVTSMGRYVAIVRFTNMINQYSILLRANMKGGGPLKHL